VKDVVCTRDVTGALACSVPRRHRHHSPGGFEIGYGGSGPADLALNVLAAALPLRAGQEGVRLWDGTRVSNAAWDLHQAFADAFLAPLPRAGGTIAGAVVEAWIVAKQAPGEET